MIICDICKKPMKERIKTTKVYTHYAYNACRSQELDVCNDCNEGIQKAKIKAEAEFYQNKLKESKQNND